MKSFLIVLLKILWVLASAWTALVFFIGISDEWSKMQLVIKFINIGVVFPTLAAIAWTLPKMWRHSETGIALITVFGMFSMFAIISGWALAATTDVCESPIRFVASAILTAHSVFHTVMAFYAMKAHEKRRHQDWRQSRGLV